MLTAVIDRLRSGDSIDGATMQSVMEQIMTGKVSQGDLVAFLVALRDKGETVEEISAAASIMRKHAIQCSDTPKGAVDTCGTGGDNKGTFNISTAAAFVVAGAGVPVAKHGNRSVSSKSGSADVLESLGVKIELAPARVVQCLQDVGIAFFFARTFHPAMKHVAAARKEIGTRTIFNLLGPLTNPAGAKKQLIGVFDKKWCEPLAQVLTKLGSDHVMVVHGLDGIDEISLTSNTYYSESHQGKVTCGEIDPVAIGLELCQPEDLLGGDAEQNAHLLRGLLEGYESPLHDAVVLNAAAALQVAGRATDLSDGLEIASKSLAQGKALDKLKELVAMSHRLYG